MELGVIAIGATVIALCAMPFIATANNRKKKQKELLNGLNTIATTQQSHLGIHDFGMEFAIGLSSAKNYVFFYKNLKNGQPISICIPINTIKNCKILESKQGAGSEAILQKLELVITFLDKESTPCTLVFFDTDEHFQPNGELSLIRQWETNIKQAMEFYPN
ncbi:hypothetical protein [Allomuricauda sp. CP2A]|jgi:hypothetical protein|uniref:hypothetical protein n=1 Tax=Allomuricauda sp. CP2A TaxID=1848189 RepID=UPI00082D514D|nr:hypothetical protein [Muricauda sp. CP2A]